MYKANLSHNQMNLYISNLTKGGLIKKKQMEIMFR